MSNNFLLVIMILCWGTGSFFYKIANNHIHPIIVSSIVTFLYVCLTPLAWIFLKFDRTINLTGIGAALIGGLLIGTASLSYFFALQREHAGQITFLSAMYPFITLILSVCFLGEPLTWRKIVGIILAGFSFFFLSKS